MGMLCYCDFVCLWFYTLPRWDRNAAELAVASWGRLCHHVLAEFVIQCAKIAIFGYLRGDVHWCVANIFAICYYLCLVCGSFCIGISCSICRAGLYKKIVIFLVIYINISPFPGYFLKMKTFLHFLKAILVNKGNKYLLPVHRSYS